MLLGKLIIGIITCAVSLSYLFEPRIIDKRFLFMVIFSAGMMLIISFFKEVTKDE